MKKTGYILLLIFVIACTGETDKSAEKSSAEVEYTGRVEQVDETLDQVLDPQARPAVLGRGYEWSEGPVWVAKHGFLLFSDVPTNTIYKWVPGEGVSEYLSPSGYTGQKERSGGGSNGLIIDQEGRLLLCQHGDRRIARMRAPLDNPSADFQTVAGQYDGKKFNSPNDLVQHSSGAIYFTDPPYGLEQGADDPARELDFQGVFRVDTNGNVTLLVDSLSRPNGLAFSPDEKTLYVANSDPDNAVWMAYRVMQDGGLSDGQVFYDATHKTDQERGLPDGMKVGADGYVYATGPGGVWIFNPAGEALGRIKTEMAVSNCAIGNDGSKLYMTADSLLLAMPIK